MNIALRKQLIAIGVFAVAMVVLIAVINAATTNQHIGVETDQLTNLSQQGCIRTAEDTSTYIEFGPDCATTTNTSEQINEDGWVNPVIGVHVGHRSGTARDLLAFPGANDGPKGVTISKSFLDENKDAAWLSSENGVPVISNIIVEGRCLNITTKLILRDSYVNCPTRIQNDSWGYAGTVDDTPAINIGAGAEGVTVEYNTITCSGFDFDICARSVRSGARDALIQFNDLSFARGAVQLFHDTTFQYNYAHDFSFGADPNRIGNISASGRKDEVTHSNAVNNQGYTNTKTIGNYIDARYGRVSKQPSKYTVPDFRTFAYKDGIVEVGDPIDGFTFTNYLSSARQGGDYIVQNNYIAHSGRPFRCNNSSGVSNPQCSKDISYNAFADDKFELFKVSPLFEDKDKQGHMGGECNYLLSDSNEKTYLSTNIFGPGFTHRNTGC